MFAEFDVPTPPTIPCTGCSPTGRLFIAAGADGNVWFSEPYGNNIGRITPAGTITEFAHPLPTRFANGLVAGPDGNV